MASLHAVVRTATLLLPLLLGHPGHDEVVPWCAPPPAIEAFCPLPEKERAGGSQLGPALRLLARGQARRAASLLAEEAERSPEAAQALADALRQLGDETGARLVAARFTPGGGGSTPRSDPAARGATAPPASPGTR